MDNNSDETLLYMHCNRPRLIGSDNPGPATRRNPERNTPLGNAPDQTESSTKIWHKVQDSEFFSKELFHQFGGQAQDVALNNYVGAGKDKDQPRLIDQMLANRTRDYTQRKEGHNQHIKDLTEEKNRLVMENERVQGMRRTLVAAPSPTLSLSGTFYSDLGGAGRRSMDTHRADSRHSVHAVSSFIAYTNARLPAQIARYNRLKEEFAADFDRRYHPYDGHLGPQSYRADQMGTYQMVRGLVEDIADRFLDNYFRKLPPAIDHKTAVAVLAADKHHFELQRVALAQSYAVQLEMEDIVLEVTRSIAEEVAEEFKILTKYFQNQTNLYLMNTAEMVALDAEEARDEEDPGFPLVTKAFYGLQADRNKFRHDVWTHSQHLHLRLTDKSSPDDDGDADDVDILVLDEITPMSLRKREPTSRDTYDEKTAKENYLRYRDKEAEYWHMLTVEVADVVLSTKCNGIYCIKPSPNGRLLAVGSVHGDITIYDTQWNPIRPIRAIYNTVKGDDSVTHFSWSHDGTHLTTINQMGSLQVWSMQPAGVYKADYRALELRADQHNVAPEQLTRQALFDVDNFDFRFHSGPLAEMELHKENYGPTLASWHPSLTMLGTQTCLCVALDNGDIVRMDLEEIVAGMPPFPPPPTPAPQSDPQGSQGGQGSQKGQGSQAVTSPHTDTQTNWGDEVEDQAMKRSTSPVPQWDSQFEAPDNDILMPSTIIYQPRILEECLSANIPSHHQGEANAEPSESLSGSAPASTSTCAEQQPTADNGSMVVVGEGDLSTVGQGTPAELFRHHRHPMLLLEFVEGLGAMVSVDQRGNIALWHYNRQQVTSMGWFAPFKKARLQLHKTMYTATSNAKPNIIFTDQQQKRQKQQTSKKQLMLDRKLAQNQIDQLQLKDPWHRDNVADQGLTTEIYKPEGAMSDAGSVFHVVILHTQTKQLSTYLTRVYKPVKVSCSHLVGVRLVPGGRELLFLLLFPGYPPKDPHLTVLIVDLLTLKLKDFRCDIPLDDNLYTLCASDDVISCAVSPALGVTAVGYMFINVNGWLSAYSLVTGTLVLRTEENKNFIQDGFTGCRIKKKGMNIAPSSRLVITGAAAHFYVLLFTADVRHKKQRERLVILEFTDDNSRNMKLLMVKSWEMWNEHPPRPLPDQRVDPVESALLPPGKHHEAYIRGLIHEMMDRAVMTHDGVYDDEEMIAYRELDRRRNYTDILLQFIGRSAVPQSANPATPVADNGGRSTTQASLNQT